MAQQATYSAVESSDLPPQRWSTGVFECVSDPQVCVMGACPMGCVQYLYAANADSAGVEPFETAFFKACGLTVVVPNVIGAVAATAPAVGAALSPLNTLTSIALAWFGMSNRAAMRRRYNIRGVSECAWACKCFSFLFDGDEEKTDDFCCYLCCFSCAVCQETRHLRRYNLGTIATKFTPYAADAEETFLGRPAGGYAPPAPASMRREAIPVATVVAPGKAV
jgi:Cys-rich protein (TIGR01571 family)